MWMSTSSSVPSRLYARSLDFILNLQLETQALGLAGLFLAVFIGLPTAFAALVAELRG
jgi:hypothetical protein